MRREGSLAFPQPSRADADTAGQPVPLLCFWNRRPHGPSFLLFPATLQPASLWGVLAAQGTDTTRAPVPPAGGKAAAGSPFFARRLREHCSWASAGLSFSEGGTGI